MEMSNKIGGFIVLFIGIIIVLSMWSSIGDNVGQTTNTYAVTNQTIAWVAGSNVTLRGQAVTSVIVTNATNATLLPVLTAGNYTIQNYFLSNGVLISRIGVNSGNFGTLTANISYTYEPQGYVTDGGSRAVVLLIPIMIALALLGFILWRVFTDGKDVFGG